MFFTKYKRAVDMLGSDSDYFDPETHIGSLRFGEESFNIRDVYQHYYSNVSEPLFFRIITLAFLYYRPNNTPSKHSLTSTFLIHSKNTLAVLMRNRGFCKRQRNSHSWHRNYTT